MFDILNPNASLVATNYNFQNSNEFKQKLEEKNIIEKFNLSSVEPKIQGPKPDETIYSQIKGFLPVIYQSEDLKIQVIYTNQDARLVVEKINLTKDTYKSFQDLSSDITDFKLSDIKEIGLNFFGNFNLKNNKLLLLNSQIANNLTDFSKNKNFEIVLPLDFSERNLTSTYRVTKISGGDNSDNDRIYRISVNNHFVLGSLSTIDKIEKLKEILSYSLYEEFLKNCQSILRINSGEVK